MSGSQGVRIHITGIVQGVGFRPFVYGLAMSLGLKGWVCNTSAGVNIEVDGDPAVLERFIERLEQDAPVLAHIHSLTSQPQAAQGFTSFEIEHSQAREGEFQPISPDVSLCEDCARELFDPHDRRYRYPFINCTNCGPRFTIIEDIPYDRPFTTMAPFEMCPDCAAEYQDPGDRRFHAQPVACPACGPHIWFEAEGRRVAEREDALQAARQVLREGKTLAVKGLGGFHLACDACNPQAVARLRERKLRVDKAFAVMMPDEDHVRKHCLMDEAESALLRSRERPIVLLKRKPESDVAAAVAPAQSTLGVMLPYTPLHLLLIEPGDDFPDVLVMTSGNISEEPIATQNEEARERLAGLADAFLLHDRHIRTRCDDSVVRSFRGQGYPLRRSRGYAPFPVLLPDPLDPILAVGAELKNAFCLSRGSYAFMSQHVGDMENYETLRSFEDSVAHLETLLRIRPGVIAYDLHPNYLASRYALERSQKEDLPAIGVQHHHAHLAACMADHGLLGEKPVIGVIFDGTGYGIDGAIWGGEFFIGDYVQCKRPYHLRYSPMPGGDAAVREPWRLALAWLDAAEIPFDPRLPPVSHSDEESRRILRQMIARDLNTPKTSSMGRLFDAVSALIGVRQTVNYEAQAAIEMETQVDPQILDSYPFEITAGIVDPIPLIQAMAKDCIAGVPKGVLAARFHRSVAEMVLAVCERLRGETSIEEVCLSGGVWQNYVLLSLTVGLLERAGFRPYVHRQAPANDGGLALGQLMIASRQFNEL